MCSHSIERKGMPCSSLAKKKRTFECAAQAEPLCLKEAHLQIVSEQERCLRTKGALRPLPWLYPEEMQPQNWGLREHNTRKVKLERHRAAAALPRVSQGLTVINNQDLKWKAFWLERGHRLNFRWALGQTWSLSCSLVQKTDNLSRTWLLLPNCWLWEPMTLQAVLTTVNGIGRSQHSLLLASGGGRFMAYIIAVRHFSGVNYAQLLELHCSCTVKQIFPMKYGLTVTCFYLVKLHNIFPNGSSDITIKTIVWGKWNQSY